MTKPVLEFRDWHNALWGCDDVEDNLFSVFPKGSPTERQARSSVQFVSYPGAKYASVRFDYDPRFPKVEFLLHLPNQAPFLTSTIEYFGWNGVGPNLDKWSARWDVERKIWLIDPIQR